MKHNQNLHCQYHQDRGHTIEDYRTLKSHLEQLVKKGRLKQFLHQPNGPKGQTRSGFQGNAFSRAPLGTINVIFATSRRTSSHPSRVMSVARPPAEDSRLELKKARVENQLAMSFSEKDKIGTVQPHDDALVVTLKIGRYDVKRVMVDQGSGAEIMYPDLYNGLSLKLEDFTAYDSPLVNFNGKIVIPRGQIQLPIQAGSEEVEVDFIVVDAYCPYTAIVTRP